MTTNENTPAPTPSLNDPAELERFLAAYRPTGVDEHAWLSVSADAAALVLRAGELTRLRVEKDIQLLGAVVAHLVERGRPITLDEALADTTLLSFDVALKASNKTRENKRGIMRRLQAVHRGLPWRTQRRADGDRVEQMVQPAAVENLHRVLDAAALSAAEDPEAEAFVAAVAAARRIRRSGKDTPETDNATWARARSYATQHRWHLTKPVLRAAVTYEVLDRDEPVATLIATHELTRRDLDLALTTASGLPTVPSRTHHDLLRGGH